ncbi:hypothetical protein H0H93_007734 [Arthromyces matolae]|nr:hypothetical protein H0H93_007734 [Arthromyces matolae]
MSSDNDSRCKRCIKRNSQCIKRPVGISLEPEDQCSTALQDFNLALCPIVHHDPLHIEQGFDDMPARSLNMLDPSMGVPLATDSVDVTTPQDYNAASNSDYVSFVDPLVLGTISAPPHPSLDYATRVPLGQRPTSTLASASLSMEWGTTGTGSLTSLGDSGQCIFATHNYATTPRAMDNHQAVYPPICPGEYYISTTSSAMTDTSVGQTTSEMSAFVAQAGPFYDASGYNSFPALRHEPRLDSRVGYVDETPLTDPDSDNPYSSVFHL